MNAPGVVGPLIRAPDGALVLEDPVDLLGYQRDCSALPAGRAGMVVRPRDAADVAEVLLKASAERVPVYVRGGGTMYAGGVNPAAGGAGDGGLRFSLHRGGYRLCAGRPARRGAAQRLVRQRL